MPDEALQASLQGRPRQAPDFSPLALAHLHSNCLTVREQIAQYESAPSQAKLGSLIAAIKDIQHTLQLLNRHGAALVAAEISALLNAMAQNQVAYTDACAHTLVFAGERLSDYIAHLQKPGAIDSALPLLPVINSCRACRGEELLSEILIVASGVELPDASAFPLPSSQDISAFVGNIASTLQPLKVALATWFDDQSQCDQSLVQLEDNFSNLSHSCDAPMSLQPLMSLFDSAEFICHSIHLGALEKSAALHSLFSQLELLLEAYCKLNPEDAQAFAQAVPERLFLNMLYYVALSDESSVKKDTLNTRFRLDRFVTPGKSSDGAHVVIEGVSDRLADSIRDAIEVEAESARAWLSDVGSDKADLDRLRKRLAQLEPALMLLGAQESMRQLAQVNEFFATVDMSNSKLKSRHAERIADALIRLERALDTEINAVRARTNGTGQGDFESILAACLSEAQLRLLSIEDDLVGLFGETGLQTQTTVAQVNAKLGVINSALQVLPLPEVSPLIYGVQSFIARHENTPLSRAANRDLATVMVSLGYYLNSVLQPNSAAGQLLLEAEEALMNLDIDALEPNDDTIGDDSLSDDTLSESTLQMTSLPDSTMHGSEYDLTIVDHAANAEAEDFIDVSLQQMNIISSALFEYEQAGLENKIEHRHTQRLAMVEGYEVLEREAVKFNSGDLAALANSNLRLLNSANDSQGAQALLQESVAVLPQLINQIQSSSDKVFGLQGLLARIGEAAEEDLTLAMDVNSILAQSTLVEGIEPLDIPELDGSDALTQNFSWESSAEFDNTSQLDLDSVTGSAQTNVSDEAGDDSSLMMLDNTDNTLEQVFYRECDQHILSLRKAVDDSLASDHWKDDQKPTELDNLTSQSGGVNRQATISPFALPNKDILRSLHTLTGSAQTVDAQSIIAIVQPLQKAALHKQRNGDYFDRAEVEFIDELVTELQARLAALEAGQAPGSDNESVVARLHEFVANSEPLVPERKPGLQLNSNVSSIANVFEEEARELLETLRSEAVRLSDESHRQDAIERIQRCLHTIKGSARMAGQLSLADRAHGLEDEIKLVEGAELDSVVRKGLGELQTLTLVEKPATATATATASAPVSEIGPSAEAAKPSEPMVLSESSFENMFALASRATVSQAKLGESMLRLREACSDIESTSARLQRLPHDHTDLNSADVSEMLSDLENARRMLADALLDAESEHTQGLRADATLHQTLIRAQLVSFSECRVRLQHTANDAANETGKKIKFVLTGEELNIDKAMFRKLMTPLEHLIRNAVVHGIEPEAERMASGKPAVGRVAVDAKIDGTDLIVEVVDDGAGIDKARVKTVVDSTDSATLKSTDNLLDILIEPGFTTHSDADQLGGRGLGLSTVQLLVEDLGGAMQLSVPENGGSLFSLRLPQKIRINQIVLVEHQSHCYAIPVNFIHTVSDERYDLSQTTIEHNNQDYACCSLDAIIKRDIATDAVASARRIILMAVHGKRIALLVDKVVGYREIIAQPLGAQLSRLQRYLGGAILSDGRAVLIPDFNRLIDVDTSLPQSNWSAANASVLRRTALIVDDSITMRSAAEQMLQGFAIDPSVARDGAEAVELISESLPDVFLVDIDMPRMNGFDFLRHLRVLHPKHKIPVVMISTRDTDKDREQARQLGAMDYLVKPYTEVQMRDALTGVGILPPDQPA